MPYFGKRGETSPKSHRILTKITLSHSVISENSIAKISSSYLKNVEFVMQCLFVKELFFFKFFFPRGHLIDQVVLDVARGLIRNGNEKF